MSAEIYLIVLGVFVSISGFTVGYLFKRVTRAADNSVKEFNRVDLEIAYNKREDALLKQAMEYEIKALKNDIDKLSKKMYEHSELITILKVRSEK